MSDARRIMEIYVTKKYNEGWVVTTGKEELDLSQALAYARTLSPSDAIDSIRFERTGNYA